MYLKVCGLLHVAVVALVVTGPQQQARADAIADKKLNLAKAFVDIYVPDSALTSLLSEFLVQQIDVIRKTKPDTPVDTIQQFSEALVEEMFHRVSELRQRIAVLYTQDFTKDELQRLVSFYDSGLGRKFVAHRRDLEEKSYKLGIEWGQTMAEETATKVKKRLRARGVDI